MFKKNDLDQSGFLVCEKDLPNKSSAPYRQPYIQNRQFPDYKLWIIDLLTMKPSGLGRFYSFSGQTVNTVSIYGVVTKVLVNRYGVLYTVDDGTGRISCWHDFRTKPVKEDMIRKVETITSAIQQRSLDEATPSTSSASNNTYKSPMVEAAEWFKCQILSSPVCTKDTYEAGDTVHVRGKLSEYRHERCLRIYDIRQVLNILEEVDRRYELLHLYKTVYSQKES